MNVLRSYHSHRMNALLVMITLVELLVGEAWAQGGGGERNKGCMNELVPFLNYLGSKNPPDSCCTPLKSVIKSEPECFCSMISNQGTKEAENAGINVTQAQQLPAKCGLNVNPLACITTTTSAQNLVNQTKPAAYSLYLLLIIAALYILSS